MFFNSFRRNILFQGLLEAFCGVVGGFCCFRAYTLLYCFCTLQEESGKRADVFGKMPSQNKKRLRECVSNIHLSFSRGELMR